MNVQLKAALAFLDRIGTSSKVHSGRTLLDHLHGTHDILKEWRASEATCLAGLCHSVYGTRTYRSDLGIDRTDLRKVIGAEAEALSWRFRVIHLYERAAVVRQPALIHTLCPTLKAIYLIGLANLVEQASFMSTRKLGSAPDRYRAIVRTFGSEFPPCAKDALSTALRDR